MQALEAAREIHVGAGTVRTLAPGTTFALTGQAQFDLAASDDERSFLVIRTVHLMHNDRRRRKHQFSELGGGILRHG
jgi:type VI secretion system secreted protein VgrG